MVELKFGISLSCRVSQTRLNVPKNAFVPVIKKHNERCDQKINSGLTDKQNYLIHFTHTDNVYKCLTEVNLEGFKLILVNNHRKSYFRIPLWNFL